MHARINAVHVTFRGRGQGRRRGRGFTLLEILVVVVIASTGAGLLITSLANADDAAQLAQIVSRWSELDHKARLFARVEGRTMILSIDEQRHELRLRRAAELEPVMSAAIPTHASVVLTGAEGNPIGALVFDRLGRSIDYTASFATEGGTQQCTVSGLTGWVTRKDEAQ